MSENELKLNTEHRLNTKYCHDCVKFRGNGGSCQMKVAEFNEACDSFDAAIKMVKECREFINSLYPRRRTWTDSEIVDVMVYYSSEGYILKYASDMVILYTRDGEYVTAFGTYESFILHIGGNVERSDM